MVLRRRQAAEHAGPEVTPTPKRRAVPRRALPVLLPAALATIALPVLVAEPAAAATCSTADGVSVIVDFGDSIKTGCAAGDPASVWAALQSAGFTVEGTQRFPTSFVCRIDGFPAPAQEACIQTPPATAYWAVWSAPAGGSWSYASQGAATLNPAPGSAVGLAFGAGAAPGMHPPAPPPATTSTSRPPATSTTRPPATSTTRPPAPTSTRPTATTRTAATSPPPTSSSPAASAGSTSDDAGVAASDPVALPPADQSPAGAASDPAAARPAPAAATNPAVVVGGGAVMALLLIGGAIVVRRQRDRAMRE